jgi:uncharacterized protein
MTSRRWGRLWLGAGVVLIAISGIASSQLPMLGAGGLLHPARRRAGIPPPPTCREAKLSGVDIELASWRCETSGMRRGTVVYLHGIADNRASASGVIQRFGRLGFDVVTYDSRAHGDSGGDVCTYGYLEKHDLRRVLDTVSAGPVFLMGTSLGAAVALQAAAEDRRVRAVIAAETFSDLRTVATERAPFFFTSGVIARAFRLAEEQARFTVDEVSPVAAAAKIGVPALIVHGEADRDTSPDHARRVFAALQGPKQLVMVPGAGHNQALRGDTWEQVEKWIQEVAGQALTPANDLPPSLLLIVRERLRAGMERGYDENERRIAAACAAHRCPHPYLALVSTEAPREVWWLNAFAFPEDKARSERAYAANAPLMAALTPLGKRKESFRNALTTTPMKHQPSPLATARWSIRGARFLVVTRPDGLRPDGARFASDAGEQLTFEPAPDRAAADRIAAEAGGGATILAVVPAWSHPAREWIDADPAFWRDSALAQRTSGPR